MRKIIFHFSDNALALNVEKFFKKISDHLYKNFALDLRAISLMRMGIALLLMMDLVIRSTSIIAHYTDAGVLPLETLYTSNWNPNFFSIYCIGTGWKIIAFIFALNFFFALALFFGYKTRFMSVVCWIFLISLHNRNPLILQGGDELLRLCLFWGIFMPWGKRYSVDNLISQKENENVLILEGNIISEKKEKKTFYNVGALGYIVLLFCVYFFSAMLKDSDEWRKSGTALYYALSLDQMAWPLGKAMYHSPGLLKFLTHYTFYLELLSGFLLFIPIKNQWFRTAFIFLIFTLHLGISLTLYVGLFFLIGMVTLVGLIPTEGMDRIEKRTKKIRIIFRKIFLWPAKKLQGFLTVKTNFKLNLNENIKYQLKLLWIGFLFFILCYNVLWCVGKLWNSNIKVNQKFVWIGYVFRFDQNWGMFAPSVFKDDGWYIYEAEMTDGKMIDLNRDGKEVDYKKPSDIIDLYENDRWRKFGEIWQLQPDKVKQKFCVYLRNKWETAHPGQKIKSLKIVYMLESTLPDYKYVLPTRTVQCDCQ